MPRLVVEKGKDKGKVLALRESSPYLVGRDLKTHLRLRDQQVSRRHLKVQLKGDGVVHLEDLDSSNGTFVNGERVPGVDLKPGDKIQVGETLIFYLEEESVDDLIAVAPTPAMPGTATAAVPATAATDASSQERVRRGELSDRELSGYRIGRLLGRGGMGTVYEAMQISLERRVAFKVLARELAADGQFVDRFTAEARAAGQLNHPNIVQVYDVGTAPSPTTPIRFYSMEFMASGSVEDLLRKEGRLSVERALPLVFDAARGLEYAEKHGVVHRDIKPDNLMISEDGVVKIGDLGIATRRRTAEEVSQEEGVSGSPHYIAPEQAMGRAIDHRADLYALGVSLYQMLSGDTPFEGSSAREVILKHLNEVPPPLALKVPSLPAEVVALVERLMEKDPTRRLASASLLLQELVPLVKRYPLANTSKLRIDGIIAQRTELQLAATNTERSPLPDTVPRATPGTPIPADTGPVEAAKPRTPPVSRAALVRLVLVLGSLALGVVAFSIVGHLRQGAQGRDEARRKLLDDARAAVDADPVAGEKTAKALAVTFDREGWHDDAQRAADLAKEAGQRIANEREKARAGEAAAAYRAALQEVEAKRDGFRDPEKLGWHELQVKVFGEVAETFAGTAEGDRAANDREQARSRLEDAKKKKAVREGQEAATRTELFRLRESLKGVYRERRFADAQVLIDIFEQKNGATDLGAKAAVEMRSELMKEGGAALDEARKRSGELAAAREWDKARTALQDLKPLVKGISRLEEQLAEDQRLLGESEKKDRADEVSRQNKDRIKAAEAGAKPHIEARNFDDAAAAFMDAANRIRSAPELQKDLERRAERLRLAAAAIRDIVSAVQEKKRASGVTHAGAQAEDATGSKVHFKGGVTVTFAQVKADELHQWARQAAGTRPDADELIRAAALAIETGAKELARQDLNAASDLPAVTKAQKEKLEALRSALDE